MEIKERIKELRERHGLTQTQLAKKLNEISISENDSIIYAQTVSYWENGRDVNISGIIKISKLFNVSTDFLLGLSLEQTANEQAYTDELKTLSLNKIQQGLKGYSKEVYEEVLSAIKMHYSRVIPDDEIGNGTGKWNEEALVWIVFQDKIQSSLESFFMASYNISKFIDDPENLRILIESQGNSRVSIIESLFFAEEMFLNPKFNMEDYFNSTNEDKKKRIESVRNKLIHD